MSLHTPEMTISPAKLITAEELHLYRRAKALFKLSRESLGYRELCKKLRKDDFTIVRKICN